MLLRAKAHVRFVAIPEMMPRKINGDLSSVKLSFAQPIIPKPISEPVYESTPVSESTLEHKSESVSEPHVPVSLRIRERVEEN